MKIQTPMAVRAPSNTPTMVMESLFKPLAMRIRMARAARPAQIPNLLATFSERTTTIKVPPQPRRHPEKSLHPPLLAADGGSEWGRSRLQSGRGITFFLRGTYRDTVALKRAWALA